ncbi:MAG TPA: site-specific DNA-methyltransferase [Candidatus Methylacidiphilales bacterium]|jgi:adenine-specific DNA-methyltransferase|nr:site-specific DNA-methyltransferase [Candidatus Methylacidiphilales bacterium]
MPKPPKAIKSYKHKTEKRAHLPSSEEAGYEDANPHVKDGPVRAEFIRNPIVHRGQDPELFWKSKYGESDDQDLTAVDIRSLYRHEHIAPEQIIRGLYKVVESNPDQGDLFRTNELFGNALGRDELEKVSDYYTHSDGWTNRLVQGDSLIVMTSLLEREGMAGKVQCIYIDPPYGIKYESNWQIKLNSRAITDGKDDDLSAEPEQIKAFRDTWELGIHSYLSYLRDRLLVARELLHESGSCFVQISDENVHLVRCLLDEVFGSANFCGLIAFRTTGGQSASLLSSSTDYLLWYGKDKVSVKKKFKQPTRTKVGGALDGSGQYTYVEPEDLSSDPRPMTKEEIEGKEPAPPGWRILAHDTLYSQGDPSDPTEKEFIWNNRTFRCPPNTHWKPGVKTGGMQKLANAKRLMLVGNTLRYKRYLDDYPVFEIDNIWNDTATSGFGRKKEYVVETNTKVLQRCLLMTTDPGDLVLDPTCGSGTTAYVAEQWGRRWIVTDTSRIALNITKSRLLTASFPYYRLYDQETCDIRLGFRYKKVPHITLGSIANDEPPGEEVLYDKPEEDKKRLRVAGPFTVETLQNYEPISPQELARQREDSEELAGFEDLVFEHLKSAGVKTGDKAENAVFVRIDRMASTNLHAEGFYGTAEGDRKAYIYVGPKFGTVSKRAVNEAVKECRQKGDAQWLLILGFSFESGIQELTKNLGLFTVSIVRMHDDLMQEGLLKKDKKAASFVTIGEPDIRLTKNKDGTATVEIAGLDIYDPIKDVVKSRDVNDIAYWMLDDQYDGSNFVAKQVFFCGGDKDEFDDWKKKLGNLSLLATKKRAEQLLKIEIDDEAFARIYGHVSHPFKIMKDQKIAVRVISQFGEETTKIL